MSKTKPKTPRLGRGLSSLMTQPVVVDLEPPAPAAPTADQPRQQAGDAVLMLPLEAISANPHQPRQQFDASALRALADSIRNDGVLQPVIVRPATSPPDEPAGEPRYELIAGERRWRAADIAGLARLPAIVRQVDDRQALAWALIENLQRQDLNPIERALGFQDLARRFDLSHDQVAERVGVQRATVSNSLRLLGLCEDVRSLVRDGLISGGHAKALAGLAQPDQQLLLAKQVVRQGWSVRHLEAAVRRLPTQSAAPGGPVHGDGDGATGRSAHLADLEQQISRQLGTKARIRAGRRKGTGTLTIAFHSLEGFDRLLERLGIETT